MYTPEGDSVALSTGIIVYVHTMSDAIKFMVRHGWEDSPAIRPRDIFANNDPVIGDVHNADVQTFVPIFWEGELLSERVDYAEPIVLPVGEGLNVVRRSSDGELLVRCDCGHDFCPPSRNWKLEAVVYVRDSVEAMREVYPKLAHADPEWMELRELYCPGCARQLEVEAAPPGVPRRARVPPRHRGLLPGLARARAALRTTDTRPPGRARRVAAP